MDRITIFFWFQRKNKSWEKDRQQSNEDELTIVSTWCDVMLKSS